MEKTCVLLVNLGTPDAPNVKAVRRYLAEFLSDRRVIDLPRWQWLPILHGIILRVRPKKSAALYQSIWTEQGSPLLLHSLTQKRALQERFDKDAVRVELAMSYGAPSIASVLNRLHQWGLRRLVVLPLYPQYSSTTIAPIWDSLTRSLVKWRDLPSLSFIRDYADQPLYIAALAARIRQSFAADGLPEKLLLSYHGIPLRYAESGDDYPLNCKRTTAALQQLFPDIAILQSYQSKFGNEEWLTPATSDMIPKLAREGVRHLAVAAPAFTADCLETLHELQQENKQFFLSAGGQQFTYIPAVNEDKLFIDCLEDLARMHLNLPKDAADCSSV